MGYLIDRTLFCLTSFVATLASFQSVWGQSQPQPQPANEYLIGLGIADITGPVVETNMMGYANLAQTDTGLYMRQRARAAIIAEQSTPQNIIVFLNLDTAMGDSGIRRVIVAALQQQFPGVYSDANVAVVGTHQPPVKAILMDHRQFSLRARMDL